MKSGTYMFPPPPPPGNELQVLCVPKDILGLRRGGSSIFPSAPQWDQELRYLLCPWSRFSSPTFEPLFCLQDSLVLS
jgi:hypothetical protein